MDKGGKLRVGIIGCGKVTMGRHLTAMQALEEVELAAVVDPTPERVGEALAAIGLPSDRGFAAHQDMLQSAELDYVLVAVPPAIRPAIIADCLERGLHVLSEKPLAVRPHQARGVVEMAQASGLAFGMVHNYLYFSEYVSMREQISVGAIGDLHHVQLSFMGVPDLPGHADYRPTWRHDPAEAGGGILMDMIHVLYVAEYLVGSPIRAVSAIVDNLGDPADPVEGLVLIHLLFDRSYASVNLGWGRGPGGVQITGSDGRILAFYQGYQTGPFAEMQQMIQINSSGTSELPLKSGTAIPETFDQLHRDFVAAVREGRDPIAPGRDGLRNLEAALAAYASAVTGRVVDLPLDPALPAYREGVEGLRQLERYPGSPAVRRGLLGLSRIEVEQA